MFFNIQELCTFRRKNLHKRIQDVYQFERSLGICEEICSFLRIYLVFICLLSLLDSIPS